jgi:hypothetical protein
MSCQSADGEAKVWIEPTIELARNYEFSDQDLSRVLQSVADHEQEIRDAWHKHFDQFPWFKHATVESILSVQRPAPQHLRSPDIDVDLAVDSIEHPERFPLTSKL